VPKQRACGECYANNQRKSPNRGRLDWPAGPAPHSRSALHGAQQQLIANRGTELRPIRLRSVSIERTDRSVHVGHLSPPRAARRTALQMRSPAGRQLAALDQIHKIFRFKMTEHHKMTTVAAVYF